MRKKFVIKNKQSRYIQFVSSEKNRSRLVSDLPHFSHFKSELLDEVHKNEAEEINLRLKALKIRGKDCFIISENTDIDQKVIRYD
jgi:hypothetical protein